MHVCNTHVHTHKHIHTYTQENSLGKHTLHTDAIFFYSSPVVVPSTLSKESGCSCDCGKQRAQILSLLAVDILNEEAADTQPTTQLRATIHIHIVSPSGQLTAS